MTRQDDGSQYRRAAEAINAQALTMSGPVLLPDWKQLAGVLPASNLGDLPGLAATEAGAAGGAVRRGRQAAWETSDVRGVAGGPPTGGD